ncbi:hypothetical protein KW787_00165 [Candidatus Pacearchaeota archaeon]|nr:hypothetical protein [Candidatus Pacearchaeota archaeon]
MKPLTFEEVLAECDRFTALHQSGKMSEHSSKYAQLMTQLDYMIQTGHLGHARLLVDTIRHDSLSYLFRTDPNYDPSNPLPPEEQQLIDLAQGKYNSALELSNNVNKSTGVAA